MASPSIGDLPPHRVHLAERTLAWCDRFWDDDRALLWGPPGSFVDADGTEHRVHLTAHCGWYGLGLLLRDGPGDRERADRLFAALCALQYDEPGTVIHGTFARFAESPHPGPAPRIWVDYDPNWRQFLGTTFLLIDDLFADRLTPERRDAMRHAVRLAVEGEPPGRVPPTYANIALMKAWLEVEAADRLGLDRFAASGHELAEQVVAAFDRHGTFDEYNSPTYYGIDLYALALWRSHSASGRLRQLGARLEANLWRDVARWYHAGLRNLCGPWTRAYGMDLTTHVGILGFWVWSATGDEARSPVPSLDGTPDHGMDVVLGPVAALLGADVPDDALAHLRRFEGERTVEQRISDDPDRVATGWLADDVMVGGERCSADLSGWAQFHPATAHWRLPDGTVGWVRVQLPGPADVTAEPGRLVLGWPEAHSTTAGTVVVRAPGVDPDALAGDRWELPGIAFRWEGITTPLEARPGRQVVKVTLPPPGRGTTLVLRVER